MECLWITYLANSFCMSLLQIKTLFFKVIMPCKLNFYEYWKLKIIYIIKCKKTNPLDSTGMTVMRGYDGKNNAPVSRNLTRFVRFNMSWKPRSTLFPLLSISKVKCCFLSWLYVHKLLQIPSVYPWNVARYYIKWRQKLFGLCARLFDLFTCFKSILLERYTHY